MKAAGTWEGGRIYIDGRGREVFYIRRMVNGVRYDISTRCHTRRAAYDQLKRFEANPADYNPNGNPGGDLLCLDEKLVGDFLKWSRDVRHNSKEWRTKQRRYLAWWADQLGKTDLRRVSLVREIEPALQRAKAGRQHRVAVLKAFYGWLRKVRHLIKANDDPTFGALTAPQTRPAQWVKSKVIPLDDLLAVRPLLDQHWRDGVDVQTATGWHVTELIRFAKSGSIEVAPGKDQAEIILLCPQTKAGEPLRTRVAAHLAAAAKRLLVRGEFGRERYGMAINEACDRAKVGRFSPGRFRHTVATAAITAGADPAAVAAFLNHKSARTTRRFYATHAAPKRVPTLNLVAGQPQNGDQSNDETEKNG